MVPWVCGLRDGRSAVDCLLTSASEILTCPPVTRVGSEGPGGLVLPRLVEVSDAEAGE